MSGLAAMTDDEFQAYATREAGLAIGDWLTGINIHRPIRTLTRFDLECMANAAIGRWIVVRSERAAAGHPDPDLFAI